MAPGTLSPPQRWIVGMLLCAMMLLPCGCVRRRLLVRTYPEGALVHVNQQEVGYTPVAVPFRYYGAYRILVEKDGFETVEVDERVDAPWYQRSPLDFFFENLWPQELRDERIVEFQLQPQQQVREHDLRERAETMRENVRQGFVTPLIDSRDDRSTDPAGRLPRPLVSPSQ